MDSLRSERVHNAERNSVALDDDPSQSTQLEGGARAELVTQFLGGPGARTLLLGLSPSTSSPDAAVT